MVRTLRGADPGSERGLTVHATVAVGGLALAFERMPMAREILRWAAAGYLLWLAAQMMRDFFVSWDSGAHRESAAGGPVRNPFLRGLLCNLLNPKAAVFLAAVCAPFLKGNHPQWWPFAIWGIIVGQAFILWSLWAWLLQWPPLRLCYERAERWIDGVFGIALGVLAVRLIVG